jgi:hypothetical protein
MQGLRAISSSATAVARTSLRSLYALAAVTGWRCAREEFQDLTAAGVILPSGSAAKGGRICTFRSDL